MFFYKSLLRILILSYLCIIQTRIALMNYLLLHIEPTAPRFIQKSDREDYAWLRHK